MAETLQDRLRVSSQRQRVHQFYSKDGKLYCDCVICEVCDQLDTHERMVEALRRLGSDPKVWVRYFCNAADGDTDAIPVDAIRALLPPLSTPICFICDSPERCVCPTPPDNPK